MTSGIYVMSDEQRAQFDPSAARRFGVAGAWKAQRAREIKADNPELTNEAIGERLGESASTISIYLNQRASAYEDGRDSKGRTLEERQAEYARRNERRRVMAKERRRW